MSTEDAPAWLLPGEGGFVRADLRFIHEYYTGMCAHGLNKKFGEHLGFEIRLGSEIQSQCQID